MKKNKPIKVIIADDHDVYLDGLSFLLNKHPDIQVLATASNGKELMEQAVKFKPDVILTDIRMPVMDGTMAISLLGMSANPIPIIAVSAYDDDNNIVEAMEAGAKGYIMKHAHKDEIIDAIRTVYAGEPYYSLATSYKLKITLARSRFNPSHIAAANLFTTREKEIIRMICQEKTNQEIADNLFISVRTLEGIRKRIMDKMKVKSAIGVTLYAVKNGFFNP